MKDYSEILRYMGYSSAADARLEELISSSLEKLASACTPHHVTAQLPCEINGNHIITGTLDIESESLAAHLCNCTQVFLFAATLGATVDRLIAQRTKIDSVEALCLQACATVHIENYCNKVELDLSHESGHHGLYLRPRFSPGYGDFDIAHQTDLLRILQANKRIGLTETNAHMLTPIKSVTAVIGISTGMVTETRNKCAGCNITDCQFRQGGIKDD